MTTATMTTTMTTTSTTTTMTTTTAATVQWLRTKKESEASRSFIFSFCRVPQLIGSCARIRRDHFQRTLFRVNNQSVSLLQVPKTSLNQTEVFFSSLATDHPDLCLLLPLGNTAKSKKFYLSALTPNNLSLDRLLLSFSYHLMPEEGRNIWYELELKPSHLYKQPLKPLDHSSFTRTEDEG